MKKFKKAFIVVFFALLASLLLLCSACGNLTMLEGDLIDIGESGYADPPRTSFYCTGKINTEVPDKGKFPVEFSYGTRSPEEYTNISRCYIEITAYNHKDTTRVIKRISGKKFYTENYACYPAGGGMTYNHTEIIQIPVSLLEGDEGWFIIMFAGYDKDDLRYVDGMDTTKKINYSKSNNKIYFNI